MNVWPLITRLNRLQKSRKFRIIASIVIAVLAIALYGSLWLAKQDPESGPQILARAMERAQSPNRANWTELSPLEALRQGIDSAILVIVEPGFDWPLVTGIAAGAGVLIAAALLGLLLTFFAALVFGWAIAWPLMMIDATHGIGQLLFAAVPLSLAFFTGMELMRLLLGPSNPVFAIARNLLSEAVRMKVSVVFIVLLILFLAYIPGALNDEQPLRYRIQQWLQYGIGLSSVVLALLTTFLAAGSVAFEQRDRMIWQTMTKPTSPWQYILGKWVGVMALNAVLLSVTGVGVYIFTEYLRHQPAHGEVVYGLPAPGVFESEDRRLLESQVLVARVGTSALSARPTEARVGREVEMAMQQRMRQDSTFQPTEAAREEVRVELQRSWREFVDQQVEEQLADMIERDPEIQGSPAVRRKLEQQIVDEIELQYRSIPQSGRQTFTFLGLDEAKRLGHDVTLIYQVNSGSNDPAQIYQLFFIVNGAWWPQIDNEGIQLPEPGLRLVQLKTKQTLSIPAQLIADDGSVELTVYNGLGERQNPLSITFSPDGLEILYPVGGYEINFVRIMLVSWVKLGFIAAISIMAATFLSFPVACLTALGILFMAESAGFLKEALEDYASVSTEGEVRWFAMFIRGIAVPVAWTFQTYAELRPTSNLVDGRLVGWGAVIRALAVLGGWSVGILMLAWAVFRKRELALYSGQ